MREITFRGKNKDGHWVYGSLNTENGQNVIINSNKWEVDEKTIGQMISFYDHKDLQYKPLFEGDIVKMNILSKNYQGIFEDYEQLYEDVRFVSWSDDKYAFVFSKILRHKSNQRNVKELWFGDRRIKHVEIIGNIYDLPSEEEARAHVLDPREVSKQAMKVLNGLFKGKITLGQIADLERGKLMSATYCTKDAYRDIERLISRYGLSFKDGM